MNSAAGLFALVIVALLILLSWAGYRWPEWSRALDRLRDKAAHRDLRPSLGFPGLEDGRLDGGRLRGTYAGFGLEFYRWQRGQGKHSLPVLRYALRLPGQAYDQPPVDLSQLRDTLGAQAGAVCGALGQLGKLSGAQIGVRSGQLYLDRGATHYALSHSSLNANFSALAQLVPLFARTEFDVRISPRAGAEEAASDGPGEAPQLSLAWRESEAGHELCPYCRDDLQGEAGLDLARCDACHTVQHAECLAEAGRCSVFGCGSERSQQVRARGA